MKERDKRKEFQHELDDFLHVWFDEKEQDYQQMAEEGCTEEEIAYQRRLDSWFLILDIMGERWVKQYRKLTKGRY